MQEKQAEVQVEKSVEPQLEEKKGFDFDIDFNGKLAVLKVSHHGTQGYVNLEAGANAKPLLDKAVDAIEALIPGDQKELAQKLKEVLSKVEF